MFGISLQEKTLFCRHMAIALKSGMSLLDGLKMIKNQSDSRQMKKIAEHLIVTIEKGEFLSKGLEKYDNVFGNLFVNIIRIAETSGTLPENLNYLAEELKKKQEIKSKVKGAMVYPIVIMVVTISMAVFMMVFIFPKMLPIFKSLKVDLPLSTKILILIANAVNNYGFYILAAAIAFFVSFRVSLRWKGFRYPVHWMMLRLPIIGKISKEVNLANISRTLWLLLRGGIKIVEGVNIVGDTLQNAVFRDYLKKSMNILKSGKFLSEALYGKKFLFPFVFSNMIAVGESTGNLTENLKYLSEYYDSEVDEYLKNLSSTLEPILLVFMGLIVGFIAISFITPIYKLTQGVR